MYIAIPPSLGLLSATAAPVVNMPRVAVIGAGPSGLSQLRAFQLAAQKGAVIPEIVCYEKQDNWGGQWNYSWRTGLDEYGEQVHSAVYPNLHTNIPKEVSEYPDYPFDEHFGKSISSFPPRASILDYLEGRAKKADIRKSIRFRAVVRRVTYDEGTGMFSVSAHDLVKDEDSLEEFDYVVVATGHYSTPNVPYFPGIETFPGRVLHASHFRNELEFKNKNVLIVGASWSAEDLSLQCWKYGCKSVTISHLGAMPIVYKWPDNIKEVPLLQKVSNSMCTFEDGSTTDVDAIILCTGYLHHFPFMANDLKLRTNNRVAVHSLYKGVVWVNNPKLFYLGMQYQIFTFTMFDMQAFYVRDIILGRIVVPDRLGRVADVEERIAREDTDVKDLKDMILLHVDYLKELIGEIDYPPYDIDKLVKLLWETNDYRQQDVVKFRDHSHSSAITGTMSPVPLTAWKDAREHSLASYLRDY